MVVSNWRLELKSWGMIDMLSSFDAGRLQLFKSESHDAHVPIPEFRALAESCSYTDMECSPYTSESKNVTAYGITVQNGTDLVFKTIH